MDSLAQGGSVLAGASDTSSHSMLERIKAGYAFSDDAIVERLQRKLGRQQSDVIFEFTRDPGYLHQYYILREEQYARVWGLAQFSGKEDAYDQHSHILVMRRGNQVVGGARLVVKGPRSQHLLPCESADFLLAKQLPELKLDYCKYGELSRLAMLPEFAGGPSTQEMFIQINRKAIASGLRYLFGLAPISQARSYRMKYKALGYDFRMLDVAMPVKEEYEGLAMQLMVESLEITQEREKALAEKPAQEAKSLEEV